MEYIKKHTEIRTMAFFAGVFLCASAISVLFSVPQKADAQTDRYDIEYSLQFNSASSRYLSKVFTSVGSTTKWTFSAWVRRDSTGGTHTIFDADISSSNYTWIGFLSDNKIAFQVVGVASADKRTTATYTSTTDWYHIVVAVDTSQGTAANRNRIYVNGTEVTSFSTNTDLGSAAVTWVTDNNNNSGTNVTHYVGRWANGGYFDGLMADVILVDGQQLDPTYFGYSSGGSWYPKEFTGTLGTTNSTLGTNGFRLDFASSTSLGRDRSGRGNNFTPTNITSSQQSQTTPRATTRGGADNFQPSGETFIRGDVLVNGGASVVYNLSKGAGSFVIDHVLDPLNKLLYHSFVESPDMKNVYDGVTLLDDTGQTTVTLPAYIKALNRDFRYLATPIGAPMPDLHLSVEVHKKWFFWGAPVFKISGGVPGGKVSWQVTGIRKDRFANDNRIPTEIDKNPDTLVDKGELLHPELYQK